MSPHLTRWNRAGLPRFRYVDGNAAVFVEHLREALGRRLRKAGLPQDWLDHYAAPPHEADGARRTRLEAQYADQRRELLWQITRSFARASHIVTEHLDAFANEGFIRTATQWESLRSLLTLLDRYPSPPASAATPLVLTLQPAATGTLAEGFQVKHSPADGGAPIVFETLADLVLEPRLDQVRLKDWNRDPRSFNPFTAAAGWRPQVTVPIGALALLLRGESAPRPAQVKSISGGLVIERQGAAVSPSAGWIRGDARLLTGAAAARPAQLNGPNVIRLDTAHGLIANDVVAWRAGDQGATTRSEHTVSATTSVAATTTGAATTSSFKAMGAGVDTLVQVNLGFAFEMLSLTSGLTDWRFARVVEVDERHIRLDPNSAELPPVGARIYRTHRVARTPAGQLDLEALGDAVLEETAGRFSAVKDTDVVEVKTKDLFKSPAPPPETENTKLFVRLKASLSKVAVVFRLPADDTKPVGSVVAPLAGFGFAGKPLGLVTGTPVLAELEEEGRTTRLAGARIQSLVTSESEFRLTLDPAPPATARLRRLYGPFAHELRPKGHDRNPTPMAGATLPLALDELPVALAVGREVLIEAEDGSVPPLATRLVEVDRVGRDVTLEEPLPPGAFTIGSLVLRGNVVTAGHGEALPPQALGSGDASRRGQSFVLEKDQTFVPDPALRSGVRADVEVVVAGLIHREVDDLAASGPTDPHYTVRVRGDGGFIIRFGDGEGGRRLPTGVSNVRLDRLREGHGLKGNLPAGSLVKPVAPDPRLAAIAQPLPATGGNEREPTSSLRTDAAKGLLALDRAVTLDDFAALALTNSSVWQARAVGLPPGPGESEAVEVVIVPAGGGPLAALADRLREFLLDRALPDVRLTVTGYVEVAVGFTVRARIDLAGYRADAVRAALEAAIRTSFALGWRRLGQPLFLSELQALVEGTAGVVDAECAITGAGPVLRAASREVVCFVPGRSLLDLAVEAWRP